MLSVIIPLLNEEPNILPLYRELSDALAQLGLEYELIFVDDGSTDGSFSVLEKLHKGDERVKVIQFRRNFGKSAALAAGFKRARGEVVITMDADLQDDPAEIPRFLEEIDRGYDMVCGWRCPRRDPWTKKVPSKIFNFLTSLLSGVKLHDFNCGLKAYRREVVEDLELYGELHRYIPLIAYQRGYSIGEIKVKHRPRIAGRSKYGLGRLSRGFFDLFTVLFLTQYFERPLHLFGWIGIAAFCVGFVINLYLTILWFMGYRPIGNRPLLTLGVLLIVVGVQFFSLGFLADMVVRTSARRPGYTIKRELK
ncbi:MAG: glycosyltransferase [Chloroflexi bacterium]|nr:MAG: glycosyltransferase [Chloroflexota bacterium]